MRFTRIRSVQTVLFLTIAFNGCLSQVKAIDRTNQQWIHYYGQVTFSGKWVLGLDGGFRWMDNERLSYLVRGGVGYQFNDRLRISTGMVTASTFLNSSLNTVESRPYEELIYMLSAGKLLIQQRLRVEERFFNRVSTDSHDFNFRYRYQLTVSLPIISLSRSKPERRLALLVSEEIFFNSGPDIVYNSFDRNRFVVGPSVHFSKSLSVALSYMHQYSKLNQPATYNLDHVLWLTVRHTIQMKPSVEFD